MRAAAEAARCFVSLKIATGKSMNISQSKRKIERQRDMLTKLFK